MNPRRLESRPPEGVATHARCADRAYSHTSAAVPRSITFNAAPAIESHLRTPCSGAALPVRYPVDQPNRITIRIAPSHFTNASADRHKRKNFNCSCHSLQSLARAVERTYTDVQIRSFLRIGQIRHRTERCAADHTSILRQYTMACIRATWFPSDATALELRG
jgi:hypothetical protein